MEQSRYQIIRLLGQGQFAKVYLAEDCSSHKLVALKEIDSRHYPTHRFLRELNFLLTLAHPHIVGCRGIYYHDNFRYLVMEYCSGGTLRDYINTPNLSLTQKLTLVTHILQGLAFAHSKNIIHCDLKPENILLQVDTTTPLKAKLSDFGISRFLVEPKSSLGLGCTGSPAYMAPERFYGHYSCSGDLYSVGVILFELLTGFRPFSGSPAELLSAHFNQSIVFPASIPFMLRTVINRALQKLPQKRFSSAKEMLYALNQVAEVSDYLSVNIE